jgi:membrane associated rhomboid family serine protease
VLGAHLVLEPRARITTLVPVFVVFEIASLPSAFVIVLWFALQVAATIAPVVPGAGTDSIAWIAHIAGFVTGLVLASPLAVRSALRANRRRRERPTSPSKERRR